MFDFVTKSNSYNNKYFAMDILEKLRNDSELAEKLKTVCDVEILDELKEPDDYDGHLTFNIQGKAFGRDASGSEYILLDDGTVCYHGSEGQNGRMAESIEEFFELVVNCPYWIDYLNKKLYKNTGKLNKKIIELEEECLEEEYEEDGASLKEVQRELAAGLGIELVENVADILIKFYESGNRNPRFIVTFKENDGSNTHGSGILFNNY